MPATTETRSLTELIREAFELIFERHDVEAVRKYWTPDTYEQFLGLGVEARGADELVEFFTGFLAAVPDVVMTIENIVEGSDQVVVQWLMTGTFDGAPILGIEPTGKPVRLRGCDVFVFTPERTIATNTVYSDGAEFARQIGMLPPRDSAADKAMLAAFNARTKLARRWRDRQG